MRIIIIGGGSAGTTCAFELRKLNKEVEIIIFEKTGYSEYSPCALPYVLSGEIKEFQDIFIFKLREYSSNNIQLLLNSEVFDIDREKKIVYYKEKENNKDIKKELNYDFLVLAAGANPFIPNIKGLENKEYLTLNKIDDAKKISENLKEGSTSIIIGGGLIGVELAYALSQKKEKAIIIEAKTNIFSSILDKCMAVKLKEYLEEKKIIVHESKTIDEIQPTKIILGEDKSELDFDKLFICTGVRPNTQIAEKIGLKINKGIAVNEYLRTTDSSIFACGDCAESKEYYSDKNILSQLGTTAVRQAKIVANNILSETKKKVPSVINNTITKIEDIFIASVGLTSERCKELEIKTISSIYKGTVRSEYYPSESRIIINLICSIEGYILGGQIIGNEEVVGRINLIALAIQKKIHIKELAELETCYNPASSPIFDPITIVAEICIKKIIAIKQSDL